MIQEEQEKVATVATPVIDYCENMWQQFLFGKKSLDTDWDAFVKEAEKMGSQELVDLYNTALARASK